MVTLYDVPTTQQKPWSPNTWKTRYSLNYKGLPFRTEWVEYPDIAGIYCNNEPKVPPTEISKDGSPYYSLPLIKDDTSGTPVFVAESFEIAKYLDKTYPDQGGPGLKIWGRMMGGWLGQKLVKKKV
jgi:Glutathione S-transferase, N-terminal domain